MQLPGFIPAELRQLARFVPTRGWDAVEWGPLLGSMRSVSWRLVSGQGVKPLRHTVQQLVPDVRFVIRRGAAVPLGEVADARQRKKLGDDILRLYFGQWLVDKGLFMDLRAARFGALDSGLVFRPNGLWIRLRPEFRAGMVGLYRSFYSEDDAAFEAALRQTGMLPDKVSAKARAQLKELLYAYFGIDQRAQRFYIDRFKVSFDELFGFFIDNDYSLHSDFVYVGFYLITLYMTLEQLGQAHDVRRICSQALSAPRNTRR